MAETLAVGEDTMPWSKAAPVSKTTPSAKPEMRGNQWYKPTVEKHAVIGLHSLRKKDCSQRPQPPSKTVNPQDKSVI